MARWTLRKHVSPSGRDEVAAWYDGLTQADQALVLRRLQQLCDMPRDQWRAPYYKQLEGSDGLLGRIRLRSYRLIGFFGPFQGGFTIVRAFRKKGKEDYNRAMDKCLARRKEIEAEPELSHEWILD